MYHVILNKDVHQKKIHDAHSTIKMCSITGSRRNHIAESKWECLNDAQMTICFLRQFQALSDILYLDASSSQDFS